MMLYSQVYTETYLDLSGVTQNENCVNCKNWDRHCGADIYK